MAKRVKRRRRTRKKGKRAAARRRNIKKQAASAPLEVPWAVQAKRVLPHVRAEFAEEIAKAPKVDGHWLNVRPDPIDFRDKPYVPGLVEIKAFLDPRPISRAFIRQQGAEGSCTGHALAAVIDAQNRRRRNDFIEKGMSNEQISALVPEQVSARMLYESAKAYDEYPEDGLDGSSVRGAIKGFYHNGVCSETISRYVSGDKKWRLTVERAKDARKTSLGSYMRLRHVLYDYHAALCETGSVYTSAVVHDGWLAPKKGKIPLADRRKRNIIGAHAFAIVGYDADGFFILNSWGPEWGEGGVAHWSYEDWQEHVLDAWVLRLAVPSEKTFHAVGGRDVRPSVASGKRASIPRIDIAGHYIHVKDGNYVKDGHYWNDTNTFTETAERLRKPPHGGTKYKHLFFYAHGGLNDVGDAVERAHRMIPVLKALEIYPIFFIWRTGFLEELCDVIRGQQDRVLERTAGIWEVTDRVLEALLRPLGRLIWREMKDDARDAMHPAVRAANGDGWDATDILLGAALEANMKLHFVGHSAGAILLGELLKRAKAQKVKLRNQLGSVTLFAPACTHTFFNSAYSALPSIGQPEDFAIYNLSDQHERDDSVALYQKSLLYLVSNSFEDIDKAPLAGFEAVGKQIANENRKIKLHIADGSPNAVTKSKTHGGFDDDPATLNHMLNRVLGLKQGTINPRDRGFDRSLLI